MMRWADRLHVEVRLRHTGLGLRARVHDVYVRPRTPSTTADRTRQGRTGYPMLQYTKLAVDAINQAAAPSYDPGYLGTAVWDFGDHVSWNGVDFGPVPPPAAVLDYLSGKHLPGAAAQGPAGLNHPGHGSDGGR